MATKRLSKFKREPSAFAHNRFTPLDMAIIDAIVRFRFIESSQLISFLAGNRNVIHRHLQKLWHLGLINRFSFPSLLGSQKANYYIDNPKTLQLWAASSDVEIDKELRKEVQAHAEKEYYRLSDPAYSAEHQGKHFFTQHELMLTRFHVALSLACRASGGRVKLQSWIREPKPDGAQVVVPRVRWSSRRGAWEEDIDHSERVPHRPDAFFTVSIEDGVGSEPRLAHFFYEADRATMTVADMRQKLRGYFYFIKKEAAQRQIYNAHPIRAVLIETLNPKRAEQLRDLVQDGSVCGPGRTGLFWITISEHKSADEGEIRKLTGPDRILTRIWRLPVDEQFHSMLDGENRATAEGA